MDKGTETGQMATIHAFLRQYGAEEEFATADETVHYGPSTSNKVISIKFINYLYIHVLLMSYAIMQLNFGLLYSLQPSVWLI